MDQQDQNRVVNDDDDNNLQNIISTEVAQLQKVYYHTKFQDPTLMNTTAAPTSDVGTTIILALLKVGN